MPEQTSEMARAIQDVTEKAQLLVREEIALAKAEVSDKASKLIKGAVFGIVAAVFLVFALIFLLHSLALGISSLLGSDTWLGYLIVGVLLILLGAIGGLIAMRFVKRGSPPMPQMAIEEAQLIKGTLTASQPAEPVGAVGARQAATPAPRERGR
jgi:uncharacterized membrane protein YqjE